MTVDIAEDEGVENHGSPAAVVAILMALLAIGLTVFLFFKLHAINQNNQAQMAAFQATQANLNGQITAALSHLNQADTSIEQANQLGGQTILASLQMLLLQGQPKPLLESNVLALSQVIVRLNNPKATDLTNALKDKVDALAEINPADALTRLTQVSQTFSNLQFIPVVGVQSQVVIPDTIQGFWSRLWYSIRSLIVVRTDNQIGTALVTDTSRFDALRTLNFQVAEAQSQIIHNQDPTPTLMALKATLIQFTAVDASQVACLAGVNALLASHDFYATAEVNGLLANIAALQALI
ncbi:MAG: hypothetical protein NTV32_07870 [Gammaproteobacteria bacterium]|nr:hypothetical protein [Gammaproteobacteria bacterium]